MALRIDLTPEAEAWIRAQAAQRALPEADLVKELVEERRARTGSSAEGLKSEPVAAVDPENASAIGDVEGPLAQRCGRFHREGGAPR